MNFTLIPDPLDPRDHIFEWDATAIVPAKRDLRDYTGMVEDQKSIGSCTSNATVSTCEMFLIANGELVDTPDTDAKDLSRLFNYKNSRMALGIDSDIGSTVRESLRSAKNQGLCSEQTWPYISEKWNDIPSQEAYTEALESRLGEYSRIRMFEPHTYKNLNPIGQIKYAIAQGYPVVVGMQVGSMLLTLRPDQKYTYVNTINVFIGNHAMLIVGYDNDSFILENSWGTEWCDKGYFKCPQLVLTNDARDLWVVKGFAGYQTVGTDLTMPRNEMLVRQAFSDMLHRAPLQAGLAYWVARLNEGMTHAEMRGHIARGDEFVWTHHTIEGMYRDILLREPDATGLAGWQASGLTIEQLVEGFIGSAEFKAKFV